MDGDYTQAKLWYSAKRQGLFFLVEDCYSSCLFSLNSMFVFYLSLRLLFQFLIYLINLPNYSKGGKSNYTNFEPKINHVVG